MALSIDDLKAKFDPRTTSPLLNAVNTQLQQLLDNFPTSPGGPVDLTEVNAALAALQTNLNTLQTNLTTVQTNLTNLQTTVNNIGPSGVSMDDVNAALAPIQSDVDAIQSSLGTDESAISSLQSSRTTDESNISSLQSTVTSLQSTVTSMSSTVTSLQTTISSLGDSYLPIAGGTMTGALEVVILRNTQLALSVILSTVTLDFAQNSARTVTLAGDATFSTLNRAAGRILKIFINPGAADRTPTWPSGGDLWKWFCPVPTVLHAGKWTILSLECTDGNDSGIVANALEQP